MRNGMVPPTAASFRRFGHPTAAISILRTFSNFKRVGASVRLRPHGHAYTVTLCLSCKREPTNRRGPRKPMRTRHVWMKYSTIYYFSCQGTKKRSQRYKKQLCVHIFSTDSAFTPPKVNTVPCVSFLFNRKHIYLVNYIYYFARIFLYFIRFNFDSKKLVNIIYIYLYTIIFFMFF